MYNSVPESELENEAEIDPKRVNKAIAYACRLLGIREYSKKSLQQKLKIKKYDELEIAKTIEFLQANQWLSDERFCEGFIRSKLARGQGLARIRYELSQKGVSQSLLEQILLTLDVDWQKACDDVTYRKVRSADMASTTNQRHKLVRFLKYRGFSSEQIQRSINQYLSQKQDLNQKQDETMWE